MRFFVLGLELGAEDAGQVADLLGDQEVVLHEALDAARAGAVAVAHAPRDLRLHVEGQPLLGPAGQVVQVAAHRPQEVVRLG